eukprot:s195_g1.t1
MNFDDESDVVSARFMQLLQQLVGQHVQEVQELRRENSRLLDSNARLLTAEKTGTVRHASSTRSTAEAQRLLEVLVGSHRLCQTATMLRVRTLAGEEVASIPVMELSDVMALKQQLHRLHGLPTRFRQRLFHGSNLLEDAAKLDSPLDLDLVLLPYVAAPQSGVDELATAAKNGLAAEVEALLQQPQNPDMTESHCTNPLALASIGNHVEVVRLLLEAGANKEFANNDGFTALMLACREGNVEVARVLLEAGANKDFAGKDGFMCHGYTALMLACQEGHVEAVRVLLDAGANNDFAGIDGFTALILACREGHIEVVRLLLEAGTNIDLANIHGFTALMLAFSNGSVEVARLLLEAGADKDLANLDGCTALMRASGNGDVEVVRMLLDSGADKDVSRHGFGYNALMLAVDTDHIEVVRLLLEAGANKDFALDNGFTALMLACREGNVEVARVLLEAGANKDFANVDGFTALMLACREGHIEVVRLLLEAGTNIDLANIHGFTALMLAFSNGSVEVARLLLEAGADKDLANLDGCTALMMACEYGDVEVVRLLLDSSADKDVIIRGYNALMLAVGTDHIEVARLLLEAGANKDLADDSGVTVLMLACREGNVEAARLLLEAGANKDSLSLLGNIFSCYWVLTPKRNIEIFIYTIPTIGQDLANNHGFTALMLARRDGHVEVERLLLEAGCDQGASAALEKVLQGLDSRSLTCSSGLPSPAGSPTRGSPTRFEPTEVVMKEREPLHASLTLLPPLEETDSSDKADETYAMGNIKSRSSEDEGHCVLPGSGETRNTSQETHMGVVASISEDPKLLLHRQDGLPYVTSNLSELMSASIFESDGYELVIGGLILVSVMVLGLQLQYQGYLIGHALSYPRMEESPIEVWQNIPVVLRWVDRSFTAIFVVDILLRVIFVGGRFFKRVFNWIDLTVVICCVLEDVFSDEFPFDAPFLRMLRFAKVARALRVLRHAQFLGSLHLLLKSVRASVEVLFWSLCLLLVIQCIAGMLLMQLLQTYLQDSSIDASVRREVFRYYGTFSATLLTMFEVLFANWAPACRILVDNVAEVFSIGFIVYRCLVGFAVLNVVSAVFLQQTMKAPGVGQKSRAAWPHLPRAGLGAQNSPRFRAVHGKTRQEPMAAERLENLVRRLQITLRMVGWLALWGGCWLRANGLCHGEAQGSRSTTSLEGVGLVQAVQSAVNQARKSESRLVRLQKEKARKEQMWAQYAKDMQSAFTKERARHAADVQKLQQDILDTQAQITEDQQQVQVAAAGCFRGMAGSSEAQKEWDALVSEGQAELGDTPMSNSDLYAMLVRCVQTASGAAPMSNSDLYAMLVRCVQTASGAAVPNILQTTNAAQASAHVPARVGPLASSGGGTTGQPESVEAEAAPGYMSASPGPALRDPYMRPTTSISIQTQTWREETWRALDELRRCGYW